MIEIIEHATREGTHAEVVGGRQRVTVTPDPGRMLAGSYTDSFRWPSHQTPATWLPDGYLIRHSGGYARALSYSRAIELAVYHARRAPKV